MAKKQTFGDKVGKSCKGEKKKYIKLIRVTRSDMGFLKFNDTMLGIDGDKNPDNVVKEIINK